MKLANVIITAELLANIFELSYYLSFCRESSKALITLLTRRSNKMGILLLNLFNSAIAYLLSKYLRYFHPSYETGERNNYCRITGKHFRAIILPFVLSRKLKGFDNVTDKKFRHKKASPPSFHTFVGVRCKFRHRSVVASPGGTLI